MGCRQQLRSGDRWNRKYLNLASHIAFWEQSGDSNNGRVEWSLSR